MLVEFLFQCIERCGRCSDIASAVVDFGRRDPSGRLMVNFAWNFEDSAQSVQRKRLGKQRKCQCMHVEKAAALWPFLALLGPRQRNECGLAVFRRNAYARSIGIGFNDSRPF